MGDHANDLINSIIAPNWDEDGWEEERSEGVPPSQAWAWGRTGLVIPDPDDYKLPRRKWWQRRLLSRRLQNPKWDNEAFKKCLGRQTIIGLMIRPLKMRRK